MSAERTYKAMAIATFVASLMFLAYQYYTSYDYAGVAIRKRDGVPKSINAPVGTPRDFTWRDNSGNVNMRGKFTPDKPGSRAGTMELRDGNGNRMGVIRVRD